MTLNRRLGAVAPLSLTAAMLICPASLAKSRTYRCDGFDWWLVLHIADCSRPVYQRDNRNGAGQLSRGKSRFGDHASGYPRRAALTVQFTIFSGLSPPITDVTVDPLSTLLPVSITFTGHSVTRLL
jgi:hypothetical protein